MYTHASIAHGRTRTNTHIYTYFMVRIGGGGCKFNIYYTTLATVAIIIANSSSTTHEAYLRVSIYGGATFRRTIATHTYRNVDAIRKSACVHAFAFVCRRGERKYLHTAAGCCWCCWHRRCHRQRKTAKYVCQMLALAGCCHRRPPAHRHPLSWLLCVCRRNRTNTKLNRNNEALNVVNFAVNVGWFFGEFFLCVCVWVFLRQRLACSCDIL